MSEQTKAPSNRFYSKEFYCLVATNEIQEDEAFQQFAASPKCAVERTITGHVKFIGTKKACFALFSQLPYIIKLRNVIGLRRAIEHEERFILAQRASAKLSKTNKQKEA